MNAKRVIEIINLIEQEPDIINWKYKDLDFWPILRLEIYMALSIDLMKMSKNNGNASRLKSLITGNLKFPFKYFRDFTKNSNFQKKDVLFLSDGISFTKVNGKYFEKFIDSLKFEIDNMNLTSLRLDPFHNYHTPRFSPSIFIQPFLDLIIINEFLRRRSENEFDKKNSEIVFSIFKNHNLSKFNSVVEQAFVKSKLIYKISLYFEKKLKKIQPKIVFVVWYYGVYGASMILACRRLSIPTVDIQHGVQGDLHAAYGSWLNVPKHGYNILPNYFWCWSKDEMNVINKWNNSIENHEAIVGGNVLLEKWNSKEYPFVIEFEKVYNQLNLTGLNILVTLSPGISTPEVLDNLFKVIADKQYQYNWLIRLHPNMLNEKDKVIADLKKYKIKKYVLDEVTMLPLYTILNNTDLHITHSSSTVIEASILRIQSIIVNEYGKELYEKQIKEGVAVVRINPNDILSEIDGILKHNPKKVKIEASTKSTLNKLFDKLRS
jgi:hypothetical protein